MGLRSSVARSRGSGDERGCAVVVARARLLACACGHATCAAAAADDDDARGDRRSDASRAFLGALGAVAGSPSSERASSSSAFGADKRCALTGEVAPLLQLVVYVSEMEKAMMMFHLDFATR